MWRPKLNFDYIFNELHDIWEVSINEKLYIFSGKHCTIHYFISSADPVDYICPLLFNSNTPISLMVDEYFIVVNGRNLLIGS
jgi:hypothetical protein